MTGTKVSAVRLARVQFAGTSMYHVLFVPDRQW